MKKLLFSRCFCRHYSRFLKIYSVEYNVFSNTSERKGTLQYAKDGTAFYYENTKTKTSEKTNEDESGIVEHTIIVGNPKNKIRYQIYGKDTLINVDYLEDEQVVYFENKPVIKWDIADETKIISNYKCNKATVHFEAGDIRLGLLLGCLYVWDLGSFRDFPD